METKTIYIAFDGTTFDDGLNCLDYERKHSFKQLSPNCVFLGEDGKPRSHEEFYKDPIDIFGMYVPTFKDAEIIHNICVECGISSPWEDGTFEPPNYYWYYYDRWENIDKMINYWTKMKTTFLSEGAN